MATLKLILEHGFWPRYCLEDIGWLGQANYEYVAFPMVCFCDIPLARIGEHVKFYGNFGLGMSKGWALRNGLNPILYIAGENSLRQELKSFNSHANRLNSDDDTENAKKSMRYVYAHSKPAEGSMIVSGKPSEKEFYQESEWRYVPQARKITTYLPKHHFDTPENLEKANSSTRENCMLTFTPQDIRYIFVKSDADIPEIVNFIQTSMDNFPSADLKVLLSRVTSLESISEDL